MKSFVLFLVVLLIWKGTQAGLDMTDKMVDFFQYLGFHFRALGNTVLSTARPLTGSGVVRDQGSGKRRRHPVILIPGLARSRLEAKLDDKATEKLSCNNATRDWNTFYFDLNYFGPSLIKCFEAILTLNYNKAQRHTYNRRGVRVRPFMFGDTSGLQYLDQNRSLPYMATLVESLVGQNYTINKNLRGAPYDFRKSHFDNTKFLVDFKSLIEETFSTNDKTPVYLVSHSLGGIYTLNFLHKQSLAWKRKYIKGFIPISAVFAGSVHQIKEIALGENYQSNSTDPEVLRATLRTWSVTYSTLPVETVFGDQLLLSYNATNYTAKDNEAILDLFDIANAVSMYKDSKDLTNEIPHPMVNVHCIHGAGYDTPQSFIYHSIGQFPDSPEIINGPGDATVNLVSLEACRRWSSQTEFKFSYSVINGTNHTGILSDTRLLQSLNKILTEE